LRVTQARNRFIGAAIISTLALALSFTPSSSRYSPSYLPTALSPQSSFSLLNPSHSGIAEAAPVSTNSSNSAYFKQTAHYLKDAFLNYWLMNGGVALYGYPVSEEFTSNGVAMQYFERSRFEYRANSTRPWKVELSAVGNMVTEGRNFPKVDAGDAGDRSYYAQTGHTLGGAFKTYWSSNGGLTIFGYPISEEIQENGRTVQYFERARFELGPRSSVQLGLLGREAMAKQVGSGGMAATVPNPVARPGFQMSFRGEATVFDANWARVISLNKGWGNLPQDYVGRGLYAAAPADLGLYGRWARVTRGNRSIFVQFIDVIAYKDIPYVRGKGIVIDLGRESFQALGQYNGGRYEVSFDLLWPEDAP
jgi:hypothetical protein